MKRVNGQLLAPLIILILLIGILNGCANRLAPDGGPYDVTPPKIIGSTPEDRSLNINRKRFVLTFDEYIQIQDIANKVIISPPQLNQPKIMAVGKRVIVELEDDLISNTTYTIDFTDAIVDNNEGNPLENFSFAFSTGDEIDTMEISGRVINIRNHEPMQSLLVGVHPDTAGWNAFTDTTFSRMSRTGDRAQFVMRNMKHGSYRVYALKENDGNYRHDMATDGVAFLNELITTSALAATRQDTTWVDSLTIDTIKTVAYTRYLPDDIVLLYYT
ncbi:MAG: Ig-like domain-containing protein, partial [Bacteroidales bacterium]|uniref:Ig-like domain-containing protein n=1 Tax=Porphyromonas sp. TaxID=1924944 RepID=UPI00297BB11D